MQHHWHMKAAKAPHTAQPQELELPQGTVRGFLLPLIPMSILRCGGAAALSLPLQLYLHELHSPPILISLMTTLAWLGALLGSLIWGMAGDRISKRTLLSFLLSLSAVTIAIFALLLPASGVLPVRFLRALVISGFAPITMAIVSGVSPETGRGRNLSYISSSRAIGWMVGAVAAGFVLNRLGFRWTFSLLACFPLLSLLFVPLLPKTTATPGRTGLSLLRYLRNTWLITLYLGVVLRQMATSGTFSLAFVYMASLGIPMGAMGLVDACSYLAQIVGLIFLGRLADRRGRRMVFLFGFALSAFVPPILAVAQSAWEMAMGHFALGISFAAVYIGSTAHISDVIPAERHGAMLGLFESTRAVGGIAGPVVAGVLMPVLGFRGMFLIMAVIAAAGFILVLSGTRLATEAVGSPE